MDEMTRMLAEAAERAAASFEAVRDLGVELWRTDEYRCHARQDAEDVRITIVHYGQPVLENVIAGTELADF